ncbi:MAG: GTPase [Pseudomonadota bacterium]
MTLGKAARVFALVIVLALVVLVLTAIIGLTDSTLALWQRLEAGPPWLRVVFVGALLAVVAGTAWLTWRILRPATRVRPSPAPVPLDEGRLREELAEIEARGLDVSAVASELEHLSDHRAGSSLSIALFGEVSTGKSTLAGALLPHAEIATSPVAGSTTTITRYSWTAATGATIELADLPGLAAVGKVLDDAMLDEARRAHAVIFVVDGDLNRQQVSALERLRALGKPLIITLNKADRYPDDERAAILARLQHRLNVETSAVLPVLVVTIAGGEERVLVTDAAGQESESARARAPDISQLVLALEELLGGDLGTINALREQALLNLAAEQLQRVKLRYREQRAEQIVRDTTRKAVVGALAAVTPGTDIVIQGYLGSSMTRQLCRVYGQEVRDVDIESFLDLSQSRVGKVLPLSLAIAGNGLKAFPGVGTVAGGLVHAVAYGLIFDAVGRGLSASLASTESFAAEAAAASVAEGFEAAFTDGVRRVARLALESDEVRRRGD